MIALFQSRHSSRIRLSSEEIYAISEEISREYTPQFSSDMSGLGFYIKLSSKDMLAISEEISREFAVRPPQYVPESVCVLMPVDPGHVHAYWHLDKKHLEAVSNSADDDALVLRVFVRPEKNTHTAQSEPYFDVICDRSESQQTITLPQFFTESNYSVAIGQCSADNKFVAFACSDITYLPRIARETFQYQQQTGVSTGVSHILTKNTSGEGKAQI